MKQLDRLYPLTPTLSQWEREQDAQVISYTFLSYLCSEPNRQHNNLTVWDNVHLPTIINYQDSCNSLLNAYSRG